MTEKQPQSVETASESVKQLYKSALTARDRAYSPYSGYKVGAAIRTADGQIFQGCNVENSSYGATACAEQVAIQKAVSELGKMEIKEVMVVTDADPAWPPCGICRQVISEFGSQDVPIYMGNLQQKLEKLSLKEILPKAFTPDHLK